MTATRTAPPPRREKPPPAAPGRSRSGAALLVVGCFLAMTVVVVTVLMSQFGTVRDEARPLRRIDEAIEGDRGLPAGWRAVRGGWTTSGDGAAVGRAGERLSVAVRPVGGVEGTVEIDGLGDADGWAVVWRWEDPGTYGLVVVEPSEGSISIVAVVSDRTRLLSQAALPEAGEVGGDGRTVAVEMAGPVVKVRVDGEVVVAGRDDRLATGTAAGIAVVGAGEGARFTHFRSAPPAGARVRTVEPGSGP